MDSPTTPLLPSLGVEDSARTLDLLQVLRSRVVPSTGHGTMTSHVRFIGKYPHAGRLTLPAALTVIAEEEIELPSTSGECKVGFRLPHVLFVRKEDRARSTKARGVLLRVVHGTPRSLDAKPPGFGKGHGVF